MSTSRAWAPLGLVPGVNVDRVNVAAGIRELERCGCNDDWRTREVITYALHRWAKGEEAAAERGAIDQTFHGVSLTVWRRVLAASVAAAPQGAP